MAETRTAKTFYQKYQDVMPKGAGALCIIQIFSTLGFSVISSSLILYTTQALKMSDLLATSITGSFVALNFFLHLLGGYIGGRYLSYRSLFSLGMLFQVLGCALVSVPDTTYLLWGLSAFLTGAGTNVTCINCMVTQIFDPNDKRREAAFLWNYSGMNIGFFIGFSLSGYFHLHQGYHELFLLSSIANVVSLVLIFFNWEILKDRHTNYIKMPLLSKLKSRVIGMIMLIGLFFSLEILLQHTALCNQLIMIIGVAMLALLMVLAFRQNETISQNKMWAFIILTLSAVMFWTLYQSVYMSINLFLERNVERHLFGILVAPQWVQNINTVVIIIGGPTLSFVFSFLRERSIRITIPLQFSLALVLIGLGFAILPIGISFADAQGFISFSWVLAYFVLQSLGELFIAPIGYAMIGQLAPIELRGLMMGTWMMIIGVSAILSDHFSKIALGTTNSINPLLTNESYSHTFGMLGWGAIVAGIILFILMPFINRLTQEKKIETLQNLELNIESTVAG